MRLIYFFILLFAFQNGFAQTILKGKIINDVNPSGIIIVNFTTKQSVNCNNDGSFSINAKDKDVLIISSINIEPKEIIVTNAFFEKELFFNIKSKSKELEEISIKSITAKSLGIDAKSLAANAYAEQRIRTGNGMADLAGIIRLLASPFKSKKPSKKELIYKYKSEFLDYYSLEKLETTFKIPTLKTTSFIDYAIQNQEIIVALNEKNKALLEFLLMESSKEFLKE